MSRYKHLVNFGCLIGSEPRGVVQRKAELISGQAFTWSLGDTDVSRIKYGLGTLVELGRLAGATRAVLPAKPGIELDLADQGQLKGFREAFRDFPLRMTDLYMGTAHPQGGNLMAGEKSPLRSRRVVNADFQVEGYNNVFVTDASVFPTSITVNPQWTIMALASLAAKKITGLFD
jgi:choline dehydrogenase-like flavoprotein